MSISKKQPPNLTSDVDSSVKRSFQFLTDALNELIDSVNSSQTENRSLSSGKAGDTRIASYFDSNGQKKYRLEIRTPDGWGTTGGSIELTDE